MMGATNWAKAVPETNQALDSSTRGPATSEIGVPSLNLKQNATAECRDGEHEETSAVTPEHHYNAESGEEGKEDAVPDLNDDPPKSFPQKLMEMLGDKANQEAISWLPHGKAFKIHKKRTFSSEVLPKYFKACKYTSFTRKLNRWGFTRVTRGPETGSYFHPKFLRDDHAQCLQMCSNSGVHHTAVAPTMFPPGQATAMNLFSMMPGGMMPMPGYFPTFVPFGAMTNPIVLNVAAGTPAAPMDVNAAMMVQQQQLVMMQYMQQYQTQLNQQMQQVKAPTEGAAIAAPTFNMNVAIPASGPANATPTSEMTITQPKGVLLTSASQQTQQESQPASQPPQALMPVSKPQNQAPQLQGPTVGPLQHESHVATHSGTSQSLPHVQLSYVNHQSQQQQQGNTQASAMNQSQEKPKYQHANPHYHNQQQQQTHQDHQHAKSQTHEFEVHEHFAQSISRHIESQVRQANLHSSDSAPQHQEAHAQPAYPAHPNSSEHHQLPHSQSHHHQFQHQPSHGDSLWIQHPSDSSNYGVSSQDHDYQPHRHQPQQCYFPQPNLHRQDEAQQ